MENQAEVNTPPSLPQQKAAVSNKLPGFVLGWAVTDLVFCVFRALFALLGIIGLAGMIKYNVGGAAFYVAFIDTIFCLFVALFGIPANILILCKKAFGIRLAYSNMFFAACSILMIFGQIALSIANSAKIDKSAFVGGIIGYLFAFIVRATLLVFYFKAIQRAKTFFAARKAACTDGCCCCNK